MPYSISTTYFKILRADPRFIELAKDELAVFDQIDFSAPYICGEKIDQLFDICAAKGVDSWLLSFAGSLPIAAHGPLGFAILCAPDLNNALRLMQDYSQTRVSNIFVQLDIETKFAYLKVACTNQSLRNQRWLLECAIFASLALFKEVLSEQIVRLAQVNFSFKKPVYALELEQLLGVDCHFSQPETNIRFASSWCRMPSPLSDADIHKINIQKCRKLKLLLQSDNDVVQHLRLALDSFFAASIINKSPMNRLPTLDALANDLNISSRTLSRRIEIEQSSYKHELQFIRQKYARQLLSETNLKIAQIAEILAYQETSNFVRAFKKWFDVPPSEWRRNLND